MAVSGGAPGPTDLPEWRPGGERPAGPGPGELRRFGFTLAGAFLALGALFLWWERAPGPYLLAVGAALAALAGAVPRWLAPVHRGWMALADVLARAANRVVLSLVFYLVITPAGLVARLAGWDPLGRRPTDDDSYWERREEDGGGERPHRPY